MASAPARGRRPSPDVTQRRALRRFAASVPLSSAAMATYVSELEAAKKSLSEALGENVKQYWANLKLWFKQKISKEEFDLEARRLLTQDNGNGAAAGGRAALRGLVWAARLAPLGAALPVWGERGRVGGAAGRQL